MNQELRIEYIPLSAIKTYENNAKLHGHEQIEHIKCSIQQYGMNDPIAVWKDNVIIEGHGRYQACKELGFDTIPIIRLDHLSDEDRRAYILVHNKLTMETGFDIALLSSELKNISSDMRSFGFTDFDYTVFEGDQKRSALNDDFIIPPFDVFDARSMTWQDRKSVWQSMIGDDAIARKSAKPYNMKITQYSASMLDPVLSEVVLKWFAPNTPCNVFDCFAGDTAFGFVSGYLGHHFTGIELREEQCIFNTERTKCFDCRYICDDGQNVCKHLGVKTQDLFFSCPPYYNLEIYSDDMRDASNQSTYRDFYKILDTAFTESCRCLKDNRFAIVVCGDIRDKRGGYYNFPGDIIQSFERNGCCLYNNIKLLTPLGSAAIRARGNMLSRKTCHVYQDVLVFFKGDTRKIKSIFPRIDNESKDE